VQKIYQQLAEAFARRPGLDGVIHGARPVMQGKHGSRSSLFYSAKNDALIPVESNLELAVCHVLEWDRGIQAYRTQPIEVNIGDKRLYPDCCIKRRDGTFEILEIKPAAHRSISKNRVRFEILRSYFSEAGINFTVVGEELCGGPAEQSNRAYIYNRGGRAQVGSSFAELCLFPTIRNQRLFQILELRCGLREAGAPVHALETALFLGYLKCDMSRPITEKTFVEVVA
jgi:hypothetical protein